MTDDLNKNSTIWDTDIFDVKPDTSKVKIKGDDLSKRSRLQKNSPGRKTKKH